MKIVKCDYCKKEYQKELKEKKRGAIFGYICSDCQKINPCGSPFCSRGNFHEH